MDPLQEFSSVTGASQETAKKFLDEAKGSLPDALSAYYNKKEERTAGKQKGNVNTLNNVRDKDDQHNLYAGGEKSGIAVQGRGNDHDLVKEILEQAKKGGAETIDHQPTKKSTFVGAGYKLGNESQAGPSVPHIVPTEDEPETVTRTLTFWRDGFSIEDGPLLRYDDPENQQHLNAIKSGRAPTALLHVKPNQAVEVKVAQRVDEDYQPPAKKPMATFTGTGNRLGSIGAPPVSVPGAFPSASNSQPRTMLVEVDNNRPVTSIQVRLGDGTRMVARFNHTHTIGDLRSFVQSSRPDSRPFVLQTTMPTKVLEDETLSLEAAGLLNAVVVQRYV